MMVMKMMRMMVPLADVKSPPKNYEVERGKKLNKGRYKSAIFCSPNKTPNALPRMPNN